jgi:serine phosphatase RsbU (regulator of sigma subunit)
MPDQIYLDDTIQLSQDEAVFLYTDGILEAENAEQAQYGSERLLDCLEQVKGTPQAINQQLLTSIDAFIEEAPQFDDIAILVVYRS